MAPKVCPRCHAKWEKTKPTCSTCGFAATGEAITAQAPRPAAETPAEQTEENRFRLPRSEAFRAACQQASGALFLVAVAQVVCGGLTLMIMPDVVGVDEPVIFWVTVAEIVGIALVFAALGSWAQSQPLQASLSGLTLFMLYHCGSALIDPTSMGRGIVVKGLLAFLLVKAVMASCKVQR
jgi:hypothetical protein